MIFCSYPFAQFSKHRSEIIESITQMLENGKYILGPEVNKIEKSFAEYCNVSHSIGLNSGTDTITLALRAAGIGAGDEVITVSHTALATVAAIIASGAKPVLVDIDPDYYTMDIVGLQSAITTKTKAVIPVHIYGQVCDMDSIMSIAQAHNLLVIEDCAQATGALYQGKRVGSMGDMACFSFYPTKNLGAIGDGGMLVTNSSVFDESARRLRQYGWDDERATNAPGVNSRLDEIQAAILNVKLKYLDQDNERRLEIAQLYNSGLEGQDMILPVSRADSTHVYHLYVIKCKDRDKLKQSLAQKEIYAGIHYSAPCHLHGGYADFCRLPSDGLPVTEEIVNNILSLPIYPELTDEQVQQVIEIIVN